MASNGKRSVRTVWYVSYLLVLSVPLIAALIIYSFAADALKSQIKETNLAHLQLLEQRMESSVEYTNRMIDSLTLSKEFTAVRNTSVMNPSTRYQMYNFLQQYQREKQLDQFITRQFIYLKRSNMVLTNTVYQDASRANRVILSDWNLSDEVYADLTGNPQDLRYLRTAIGASPVVLYAQSLPYGTQYNDVTLVVAFSESAIIGVLDDASWSGESLACVLNREGDVILSTGNTALATAEILTAITAEQGEHEITLEGARYVYFNTGLNGSGLRYLYIAPYGMIYQQASLVQFLALAALLAGLIISLILSGVLVRRNYVPVDTILKSLETPGQTGNEYDRIIRSIERDKLERSDLSVRLEDNRRMLGGELLDRFLSGRMVYNATTYRLLSSYGLEMTDSAYCVLCLQADTAGSDEDEFAMQDMAAQVFRRLAAQAIPDIHLHQSARRIPLIFVLGMDAARTASLAATLQACLDALAGMLKVQVDMSLSGFSQVVSQLPDLYRQADTALEYAQMRADGQLVLYPEKVSGAVYYYQVDDELMLMEAVREGRSKKIIEVLRVIADRYAQEPNVAMTQCLRFDLIATCYRVFAYADSIMPREAWWDEALVARLDEPGGVMDLLGRVKVLLIRIADAMASHRSERKEDLSDRICTYVDGRWQEDSLSVATIAAHFGMHTSYVSRMFKEEKGMGLLEYINRLRIERSLPMLRQGLSVAEIATQTGFASDASYIRVFKQYMGTTPGKYREISADK